MTEETFIKNIWTFYEKNHRDLPWRSTIDPYLILVSEMMLQQTQVARVSIKYPEFIGLFPDFKTLAKSPMTKVLATWKGLGYNRRAYFLKQIAEIVSKEYKGKFPDTYEEILKLPGIGQSTAGALSAFSFYKKQPFIETNIRAVFMHDFFEKKTSVSDSEILIKIKKVLDLIKEKEVKDFYYALYDYGTHLKQTLGTKSKATLHQKSLHYKKQTTFKGSDRQLRALILDFILIRSLGTDIGGKPGKKDKISKIIKTTKAERSASAAATTTPTQPMTQVPTTAPTPTLQLGCRARDINSYIKKSISSSKIPFLWNLKTEALITSLIKDLLKKNQIVEQTVNNKTYFFIK